MENQNKDLYKPLKESILEEIKTMLDVIEEKGRTYLLSTEIEIIRGRLEILNFISMCRE